MMSKVGTFEDLEVWKFSRQLAKEIFELTLEASIAKDFSLKDQINRSAGSIMDNIAEGFERGGNKELIQFLFIAKGSAGELRSQLLRAYDRNYIDKQNLEILKDKTIIVSKQLSGFINYLKKSKMKGEKYHVSEPNDDYNLNFEY